MVAVPAFLLLSLLLGGFGDRLARRLGLVGGPPMERAGFGLVLGIGALTPALFVLAWLRLLTPLSCSLLVLGMAAAAFGPLREASRSFRSLRWRAFFLPDNRFDRLLTALCGASLVLGFLVAMAPPTGIDAGVYHFTIPKLIVQDHGLRPREDVWIHKSGSFYPVYAFGMVLGGEILAKLLAFGLTIAGFLLCASVSERLRPGAGRAGAFLVASTPLCAGYLGYEFLELPVLAYLWAGMLALLRAPEGRPWVVLLGFFAGLAVSAKPSAFPVVVLLPAALLPLLRTERARALPLAAASLLVFGLTAGCWILWNLATIGTLMYRYPGLAIDGGGPVLPIPVWAGLLKALGIAATSGLYWSDSSGPFIVAGCAGFALFADAGERRTALRLLAAGLLCYLAVLAAISPAYLYTPFGARYLAPCVIGFGAPVAAQYWTALRERPGRLRTLMAVALVLPALPLLVLKAGKAAVATPAALGFESRSAYLSKKIETFAACEQLNRLPDPGVKVLFMAVRPYYLDRPFVWVPYTGQAPFLRGLRGPEDFVRRVREAGFTHVLFEPTSPPWEGFEDPDRAFQGPFREIGRWPWKASQSVRLYAVENP